MRDAEDAPELSLKATVFLIAIDPASGRLVKRRRRRFRRVLAGSRRSVVRELRARGYIERSIVPGRYPIVVGSGASVPFGRLQQCVRSGRFETRRDRDVFVVLAWTGVLAQRLSRSERRTAGRRLKDALRAPEARYSELDHDSPLGRAVGEVAYREQVDVLQEAIGDLVAGDSVTIDLGGGDVGGSAAGGGGDGQ